MRGKVPSIRKDLERVGITPAYAGKSGSWSSWSTLLWDHPRVCGEKPDRILWEHWKEGSPPRMRGKALAFRSYSLAVRITPAYAGKSNRGAAVRPYIQDHPRVCGEKLSVLTNLKACTWITPAYAGKSLCALPCVVCPGDHPRVCGEKSPLLMLRKKNWGSPPRMRGKVHIRPTPIRRIGITPAYAGKRLKRSRSTVSPVAIVPLFPSVCNKPVVSDGSPAVRDAPFFLPAENAVPASPACNLRSL